MGPRVLDISLFLFYLVSIAGLGLVMGAVIGPARRAQRIRSRRRAGRS